MRSIALLFAVAASAGALALVPAAGADEPERFATNFHFNCRPDHNIGVPTGHVLELRMGWGAKTRGLVEAFLQGHEMTAVVDGVAVANPEQYWGEPFYRPADDLWIARWVYDTGIVVTPERPFTIEIAGIATHRIHDGIVVGGDHDRRPLFGEPGASLFDSDGPCSVTAF